MIWHIIISSIILWNILTEFTECKINDGRCIGSGKHCFCDELCDLYGDCCYDSSETPRNNNPIASCYDGYYVIDKCYGHVVNEDLRSKCEDAKETNITQYTSHVPVYGNYSNTPLIFKNVFCAVCNGKYGNDSKFADVVIRELPYPVSYNIPNEFKRVCYKHVISTCSEKDNDILKSLCYQEPTFYTFNNTVSEEKVYRNAYCYLCNTKQIRTLVRASGRVLEVIDFNKWCFNDCQALLESFRNNHLKRPHNCNSSIPCSRRRHLMGKIEKVILIVFSILSMTLLLFLIFVYSCVEDQEKLAPKITVCLAISILLLTFANTIFYSIKNPKNTFCFYFSLAHHYCFLSSFSWMSIFALDVYHSITSSSVASSRHATIFTSKKFRVYCFVGYGVPLAFTITAVTIQLVNENNILSAGFGERQCFINRLIGGLVWLFIPLCVCLFINIIVCGFLYRFIYHAGHQTAIVTNAIKARKQSFILCIKLSALFGAVWLPAFLGIFLDNYVLKFVGGIFSSLQGVIFSLSLIFGVKIRQKTYQYLRTMTESKSGSTNVL